MRLFEAGVVEEDRLPAKKWLSNMSREVIDERRLLLQDYLNWLMNTPSLVDHFDVQEFMRPVYYHPSALDTADDEMALPTKESTEHEIILDEDSGTVVSSSTSSSVAPSGSSYLAESGKDMFSWESRHIFDPRPGEQLAKLLVEEIARCRAEIYELKQIIKKATPAQEEQLSQLSLKLKRLCTLSK
mmetsp:Transcript_34649/g.87094  ORF Transcript_34649/g.87094 Transcript_34649/m.87094 type:complete len:186 (-) Transcript_34649:30-587(-)